MTRLVATVVMWLALVAVIVVAGAYTVYYLLAWQWGRAELAGTAFVAALVVGSTLVVLGRLQRIERRLDRLEQVEPQPMTQPVTRPMTQPVTQPMAVRQEATENEPTPDFPWLSARTPPQAVALATLVVAGGAPDQSVFIPVFLAAGLVVSFLAGAVERLSLLRHGGRAGAPPPGTAAVPASEVVRTRPLTALVVVPVAGLVAIGLLVGGLYWASHYWSRPIGPGITTMTVEVDTKGATATDLEVVETAGRYCALDAGTKAGYEGVRAGPGRTTLLRFSPLLDDDAQDRLVGCLEDVLLEYHQLTVTDVALAPR